MEEQFTQAAKIEEVEGRFAEWRKERKHGAAIPGALWDDAVSLCTVNSISKVCGILHLDYKVLKKRLYNAFPDRFSHSEVSCSRRGVSCSQSLASSDFIAVDLSAPLPEFIIDMESAGRRMHIHVKGSSGFHPHELVKTFWGRG